MFKKKIETEMKTSRNNMKTNKKSKKRKAFLTLPRFYHDKRTLKSSSALS